MKAHTMYSSLALASTIAISALIAPASAQPTELDQDLFRTSNAENARFGRTIAANDGRLVVCDDRLNGYLYDIETQNLLGVPTPFNKGDQDFGSSAAFDNGLLIIGTSQGFNWLGKFEPAVRGGSAQIFNAESGSFLRRIQPDAGGDPGGQFGYSVAIENGKAVIGAPNERHDGIVQSGAVYLYDANTGVLLNTLQPDIVDRSSRFGFEVAIDNGIIAASAIYIGSNTPALYSYVYLFDVDTGNQIAHLQNNNEESTGFGFSMDMDDGILAIGTPFDSDNGTDAGAVYLHDATTGAFISKLFPDDPQASQNFGHSVAIENGVLVVGAIGDDFNGDSAGAAYIFDVSTGNQIEKYVAIDGSQDDLFGNSVAIDENTLFIGAPGYDGVRADMGNTYLFELAAFCRADLTGDSVLDFFDISAFLTAYTNQDPIADFNDDGNFDFFDMSTFTTIYSNCLP